MKEIRSLLLDCRAALRKADGQFERTPLCEELDDTLVAMAQAKWSEQARAAAAAPAVAPVSQRVAYAWQSVARELRRTHIELYQQLSERVLQRLDTQSLDDPADEIEALQQQLQECESQLQHANDELAALRNAMAEAVPQPGNVPGSEASVAGADNTTPTRDLLQAVAAGERKLTGDQRDWCIGEAMVLTGFERTPVQLLENGEAALAQLILDGALAQQ